MPAGISHSGCNRPASPLAARNHIEFCCFFHSAGERNTRADRPNFSDNPRWLPQHQLLAPPPVLPPRPLQDRTWYQCRSWGENGTHETVYVTQLIQTDAAASTIHQAFYDYMHATYPVDKLGHESDYCSNSIRRCGAAGLSTEYPGETVGDE